MTVSGSVTSSGAVVGRVRGWCPRPAHVVVLCVELSPSPVALAALSGRG